MKNNYASFLIVAVFVTFLFFIPTRENSHGFKNIKRVNIAGQNIKVETALTIEEKAQGLSGRKSLNDDEGMLFVFFPDPDIYPFWMKDMNFAIDIIWIGADQKVVYIQKDARPESYPRVYDPLSKSEYVLEVVSGFSEKNNLQVGDGVEFVY